MEKGKTPSTPPSRGRLDVAGGESSASKDEIIARLLQQNAEYKKLLAERENTIAQLGNTVVERENIIAQLDNTVVERENTITQLDNTIVELDNTIVELDNTIAEQKKNVAKTKFLDFLHLVHERVYDKFTVETDRSQLALGTTSVAGKFCPRRLRRWADFEALHDQKFHELEERLNPLAACFASPHDVSGFLSAFSPKSKNEATLRPFLRIALEKPAAAVVNEYLHAASEHPDTKTLEYVHFTDDDKETQTSRSSKNTLGSSGTGGANNPDRICLYDRNEEAKVKVRFLVGEYKAAHRLTAPKLEHMLDNPPEDYLAKAAGIDKTVAPSDAPNDAVFSSKYPSVYLAKALCQAYHYMISGALEYGYIATGYGLLLLHVPSNDLDTLYYHKVTFTLGGARQDPLPPKQTAAAYMSTLLLLSIRDTGPSDETTRLWARGRMVWPRVQYKGKRGGLDNDTGPEDPDTEGGGAGGSTGGQNNGGQDQQGGGGGAEGSGSKRSRGISGSNLVSRKKPGGGSATQQQRPLARDLPFCTQACLLGVVHQLPLDDACPNLALHRAASLRMHGVPDRHPLTEAGIRRALRAQASAAETDVTQRCYPCGREGRYGALVRVAVTCAGYVFVAKATYVFCVEGLEHELRVYNALKACQGKLIPVCLGLMTFTSSRFTTCSLMRSMLFLSYAGRDLGHPERLPWNVDLQTAMDRTADELYGLGLRNRDIRVYNCAWNPETRRVLHFDFDQATMAAWETKKKTRQDVFIKEDGSAKDEDEDQQEHEPKAERSPLLSRGVNTLDTLEDTRMDSSPQKKKLEEDDALASPRGKRRRANT